jgi:hypothetical protein
MDENGYTHEFNFNTVLVSGLKYSWEKTDVMRSVGSEYGPRAAPEAAVKTILASIGKRTSVIL